MQVAKVICTHSGTGSLGKFHADEVLACSVLHLHPVYCNYQVLRTREQELVQTAEVAVDIGGEWNPEKLRFDHHQVGFSGSCGPDFSRTLLSSAGLIYKQFGKATITHQIGIHSEADLDYVHTKLYQDLIECVDANDNGIPICRNGTRPKFRDISGLASHVYMLNGEEISQDEEDRLFHQAVEYAEGEFLGALKYIMEEKLTAREFVMTAYRDRRLFHDSGKVLVLSKPCPWTEHIASLGPDQILICIYPNKSKWTVQRVERSDCPSSTTHSSIDNIEKLQKFKGAIFINKEGTEALADGIETALDLATLLLEHT